MAQLLSLQEAFRRGNSGTSMVQSESEAVGMGWEEGGPEGDHTILLEHLLYGGNTIVILWGHTWGYSWL